MSILFNLEEIHIELSSKCTLKCPRCPRTELKPEQLNREITLNEFITSFDENTLSKIKKIVFCGDVGDPIYAKDFLDILRYIKYASSNTKVSIVTNGSYKDVSWWKELATILQRHDKVTFSLDGWDQESNEKYRVNCNWDSIITGAKTLRAHSVCDMNWSAIYFNFNEDHISKMSTLAQNLGFNTFESVRSSKFGPQYFVDGVDPLIPLVGNNIASSVYKKTKLYFTKPIIEIVPRKTQAHPWAKCLKWTKEMFISVDGLVFPCPWFNSGYQENDFVQKYADRMSIKTRPLLEILEDPMWNEFITRIETMPLEVCKLKCKDCNE